MINRRYLIQDKLGRGGNTITYQAVDTTKGNSSVAIKNLSLSGLDDWKKIELFEREAEILKQLNHSSIPKYIDYFKVETEDNIDFCLVQQLALGQSLATLIENGWKPDEVIVKEIAEKILNILVYLQELTPPVIHRDIKPQNIIYQPDTGKLFLVDFGAVKHTYSNTMMASTVVGTYGYMAPEQFRGQAVLSTDLYGLGCTLLFLLTGKSPTELPQKKLKINFRSILNIQPHFANWLEKLIEPDLTKRFTNARDAFDVLTGKIELEQYAIRQIHKPQYTSIYFLEDRDRLTAFIPPALLWEKYNIMCFAWMFYCIFILINIGIVGSTNLWLGYAYTVIVFLGFFANSVCSRLLQIIDLIYLAILLIVVVYIRGELVQFIPIFFIFLDNVFVYKTKNKIIKDFFFDTRIQIVNRRFSKYLKVERRLLRWWYQETKIVSNQNLRRAMDMELYPTSRMFNLDYHFGYLLTVDEKQWLQKKLIDML